MPQMYALTVTAVGEVRDSDGNLISSEPVESRIEITEEQATALGYTPTAKESS